MKKFKIGDRVYIKSYKDTGVLINIYSTPDGSDTYVVDPDHPEKHVPKERYKNKNDLVGAVSIHTTLNDLEPLKLSSNKEWKDIWDQN